MGISKSELAEIPYTQLSRDDDCNSYLTQSRWLFLKQTTNDRKSPLTFSSYLPYIPATP